MRVIYLVVPFFLMCSTAVAEIEDFDCSAAEYLVSLFEEGVDQVVWEISDDPEWFVRETLDGWECLPEPLEMERRGRAFIKELLCIYSTMNSRVRESDFVEAGEIFKRNVSEVEDCFSGETLTSAPLTYSNQTRGEAIILILDRDVEESFNRRGRQLQSTKVLLHYGYVRPERGSPLFWELKVGGSVPDSDR